MLRKISIALMISGSVFIAWGVASGELSNVSREESWNALYFHGEFPSHGQFYYDTAHDIGSLRLEPPEVEKNRYCSQWVMFDYDVVDEEYHYQDIKDIYFHVWFDNSQARMESAGYRKDVANWVERYGRFEMDDEISISGDIRASVGNYALFTTTIDVGITDKENVFDFGVVIWKLREMDGGNRPTVISGPERISFVIFNLKGDEELRVLDTDSDGVSDYDELYTIYTNPFDADTDSDGFIDSEDTYPNVA